MCGSAKPLQCSAEPPIFSARTGASDRPALTLGQEPIVTSLKVNLDVPYLSGFTT